MDAPHHTAGKVRRSAAQVADNASQYMAALPPRPCDKVRQRHHARIMPHMHETHARHMAVAALGAIIVHILLPNNNPLPGMANTVIA